MLLMSTNNIRRLVAERARLSRRLTMFEGYGIPYAVLSELYERLEELDVLIHSQAVIASWAGQPTGEA